MKKLTRKLFLSIAALACCAATLVSTTFAWYVNNPQSTVGEIAGTTASAGTTGSISVSKDGTTWKKNLDAPNSIANPATGITPVTPTAATLATFNDVDGSPVTGAVIQFSIWVKADVAGTATVTCDVENTGTLGTQVAFVSNGLFDTAATPAAIAEGTTITCDAVNALRMGIQQGADLAAAQAANATVYEVDQIDTGYVAPEAPTGATLLGSTSNAHTYYSAINSEDSIVTTSAVNSTSGTIADITLAAGTPICFVYTVWLEGTDTMCFNACAAQNFSFDFTFDFVAA